MEEMKYLIFYREDNSFDDILNDPAISKLFDLKLSYYQHIILGSSKITNEIYSYIIIKYGDDLKNTSDIFIDRSPKPGIDYMQDPKRPNKFKNQ
jgi:hypothetical protein